MTEACSTGISLIQNPKLLKTLASCTPILVQRMNYCLCLRKIKSSKKLPTWKDASSTTSLYLNLFVPFLGLIATPFIVTWWNQHSLSLVDLQNPLPHSSRIMVSLRCTKLTKLHHVHQICLLSCNRTIVCLLLYWIGLDKYDTLHLIWYYGNYIFCWGTHFFLSYSIFEHLWPFHTPWCLKIQ